MRLARRATALLLVVALTLPGLAAAADARAGLSNEEKRALHALNRLTFGPRPGEVERVRAMGVEKWIERQLHPERIDDDGMEARLAGLRTLKMDARELVENFPPPQLLRAVESGRVAMPSDPNKRAIYQAQIEVQRARRERKQRQEESGTEGEMSAEERAERRELRRQGRARAEELLAMSSDERFRAILRMSVEERRAAVVALSPEERERALRELTPEQRETVLAMIAPQLVILGELQEGKLLRAAYSERQLLEVMTDFWFNHFNVFALKGADRYLVTEYERDVIRPQALGKFKDLLETTAQSPAMLFYLDNWLSVGPKSGVARDRAQGSAAGFGGGRFGRGRFGRRRPAMEENAQRRQLQRMRTGLNENYARELLELHTLGVNGGYTQQDVTEVAKVFTGWTIRQPRRGGGFAFNERMHEPGAKTVLGETIKEDGQAEGRRVLETLARHPATAKFISRKLAEWFVSDTPPPALVESMAATFRKKDGDIREVLRAMLRSPEFWSAESYRAKVKTPLEFVVSAVRATGAEVENALPLAQSLNRMGMPLYAAQPPTGYKTNAAAWVNSAALVNRLNFALALGTGRLRGVSVDVGRVLPGRAPASPEQAVAAMEQALLAGDVSRGTRETIRKQLRDPQITGRELDDAARAPNLGAIAGLLLGSPEFQRR